MSANQVPWLNALFACSMVERVPLWRAREIINAPVEALVDATKFHANTALKGTPQKKYISDYYEVVTEAFKRLEAAN